MALMSFNVSPFYQLPFEWTTEWYASLWQNDQLISATWNSLGSPSSPPSSAWCSARRLRWRSTL
jgi:hypothetical protein